jgi:hypothetical protein
MVGIGSWPVASGQASCKDTMGLGYHGGISGEICRIKLFGIGEYLEEVYNGQF